MSECASRHDRGRMVALVFSMQGIGLVLGPVVAIGLLKTGISHDLAWRIMLALGAVPVFQLPNRSGRSRHGHPARVRKKIPSITSR
jgi:MFS family permease